MSEARRGILVMSYGTPASLDDVEAYYTDIRHGRPPTAAALEALTDRYRAIGGTSPLLEITRAQARGIEERVGVKAFVGQKHAAPFIPDAVRALAEDGVEEAVGFVLAPHYSNMSIGDYSRRAQKAAADTGWTGRFEMVEGWHLEPGYVNWLAGRVVRTIEDAGGTPADTTVLFSAHSLPEKILAAGDPYPRQLEETARAVAGSLQLPNWRIAWQSAGRTDEPWLGPDILELFRILAGGGVERIVVCPCGFVADHLEILYDLDIEAKGVADELGISFARTPSPNGDPDFLDAIAGVVRRAFTT